MSDTKDTRHKRTAAQGIAEWKAKREAAGLPMPKSPQGERFKVMGAMHRLLRKHPGMIEEVARVPFEIALDPDAPPGERLAAVKWITDRLDGPIVKELHTRMDGLFQREVILVGPALTAKPPEWPAEVLQIDAAEADAAARQESGPGVGGEP